VTISGISLTNDNGWEGLRVESNGAVSLNGLDASNNRLSGARISGASAKLSNLNLSGNGDDGLNLETTGAVTIEALRAWKNQDTGATINTQGNSLTIKNSSFLCNEVYGLAYVNDPEIVFTAINNAYQKNGRNYPDGRDNVVIVTP